MPLAQDVLRTGYTQKTIADRNSASGFYAETSLEGSLLHFGFYKDAGRSMLMERDFGPRESTRGSRNRAKSHRTRHGSAS